MGDTQQPTAGTVTTLHGPPSMLGFFIANLQCQEEDGSTLPQLAFVH